MVSNTILLEKILKRILKESSAPSIKGLAICLYKDEEVSYAVSAALYKYDWLLSGIESDPKVLCYREEPYKDSIVGQITVKKPSKECGGAWEVASIAGSGFGKTLYGLGYAISANGILIPDRSAVSDTAYDAWTKQYAGDRPRQELNRVDCYLHNPGDYDCSKKKRDSTPLNFAYEAYGWEFGMKKELEQQHELTMKKFAEMGADVSAAEELLKKSARLFFISRYREELHFDRA